MKKITSLFLFLCVTLLSTAQDYVVESIGFNPPHSYVQIDSEIFQIDDTYSGVIPIGFDFEFYGNTYNELLLSTNGTINFDTTLAEEYCPWQFDNDIPDIVILNNAIFGPY